MICGNRYFWCVFDVGWQILTNSVCQVWRFPGYLYKYRLTILMLRFLHEKSNGDIKKDIWLTWLPDFDFIVARFVDFHVSSKLWSWKLECIRFLTREIECWHLEKCQTNRVARFWQQSRQICSFLGCHLNYLDYKPKKLYPSVFWHQKLYSDIKKYVGPTGLPDFGNRF